MPTFTSRRALLLGVPALVIVAGVASAAWMMRPPPSDLDLSLQRATDSGLYVARLAPETEPVSVGPMHSWTLTVEDRDGAPIEDARITIGGGMPQHGHGLPTAPAVTEALGDGRFLIEGMKFNMPGWWEIDLSIDGPTGADTITFNLVL